MGRRRAAGVVRAVAHVYTATTVLGLVVTTVGAAQAKPKVAATIFPLYDIAREVAGAAADVVLVLPPGASPHTFEPTPAAVRNLAGCDALLMIGYGLDDWAARIAEGAGVRRALVVDGGIALRHPAGEAEPGTEARRSAADPHYWLSIPNGKAIAATVAGELERLAPERRDEIHRTLAAYAAKLDAADQEIRRLLADLPTRKIATFHDAFGYFADAYGLEVAATFEPFPGSEPGPRFVEEFQRTIRATGIRVLFTEPQLSVAPLRPIARDLGVTLSMLDPLGGVPGRASYVELMLFNARQVSAAARGPAP
jgi:ABC-type Zn uptake system ZnuABC Zn-binding protein ZnuA